MTKGISSLLWCWSFELALVVATNWLTVINCRLTWTRCEAREIEVVRGFGDGVVATAHHSAAIAVAFVMDNWNGCKSPTQSVSDKSLSAVFEQLQRHLFIAAYIHNIKNLKLSCSKGAAFGITLRLFISRRCEKRWSHRTRAVDRPSSAHGWTGHWHAP